MALPAQHTTTTDAGQSLAFLRSLFHGAPAGWVELTSIAPGGRVHVDWFKPGDWAALTRAADIRNAGGLGVYLGLGLRRERKSKGRGNKGDVTHITSLWAEVDAKDFGGDLEAARSAIEPLKPSFLIASGGGFHGYWLLDEPLEVTDANRRDIERTLKGLAKACNGDPAVAEVARVMRLPGTVNTKPGRNGARCEIVGVLPQRYDFADLFLQYAPLIETPKTRSSTTFSAGADASEVEKALSFIPADSITYDDWITVLAGLTNSLGPSDALTLAERWTHDDAPGGLAARIASFKPDYTGTAASVGSIFHIAKQYGYQPAQRETLKPVRVIEPDEPRAELPPVEEPDVQPLTMEQITLYLHTCDVYPHLHMAALDLGKPDGFTIAEIAERLGKSTKTIERHVREAEAFGLVAPVQTKIQSKESDNLLCKNVRRYRLTPMNGDDNVHAELPISVLQVLERKVAQRVRDIEAQSAGLDDDEAEDVDATTAAAVMTSRARKVNQAALNVAEEVARKLEWAAVDNQTPFTPDTLPASAADTRTMLIEAAIAMKPDKVWRHSEFALMVGRPRGSIAALIKRSKKFKPAPVASYQNFTVDGDTPDEKFKAATKTAREEGGAPCGWIDVHGEVVASFGPEAPATAVAVRLNMGKKYLRVDAVADTTEAPETPQPVEKIELTPEEKAAQQAERAKRRARADILPRLRGCLLALGWTYVPGPYAFWTRNGHKHDDNFEGVVQALLEDREWAKKQREIAKRMNAPGIDVDPVGYLRHVAAPEGATVRRREVAHV